MNKTLLTTITASALVLGAIQVAEAGRGGSWSRIQNAVNTGSQDAIIAEIERAERLICGGCISTVMDLLDDERYEVREAAAWWFARRPAQKAELNLSGLAALDGNDSIAARNAADMLGAFEHPQAVEALTRAATRTDLSAEARQHAVRALGTIGHDSANLGLEAAMADSDATVRREALNAWIQIRTQRTASPAIALIADSDVLVRRKAAAVVGRLVEADARISLEAQLRADDDAQVRRNAAWALGRIGDASSRAALEAAAADPSSIVRMTARAALRNLR